MDKKEKLCQFDKTDDADKVDDEDGGAENEKAHRQKCTSKAMKKNISANRETGPVTLLGQAPVRNLEWDR